MRERYVEDLGLPSHPPVRPVRRRQPSRQPSPRARAASRAVSCDGIADRGDCHRRSRSTRRAAAMPLLWRPHAGHRGLRPRLRAQVQAKTRTTARLEGHLMMPPTKLPHGHPASDHRWSPPASPPRAPSRPIGSRQRPPGHHSTASAALRPDHSPILLGPGDHSSRANSPPPPSPPTSNPHSPAPLSRLPHPRDFVPWRFSDASRRGPHTPASPRRRPRNLHNSGSDERHRSSPEEPSNRAPAASSAPDRSSAKRSGWPKGVDGAHWHVPGPAI
jgi:hypothetical protein